MNPYRLKFSTAMLLFITVIGSLGYLASCTQKDQIVLTDPTAVNTTDLISTKTTAAPTIDGTIDAVWDKAPKLNAVPEVPDPGNALFAGYIGEQFPVTLRSLYDDENIYFLAEYADPDKSVYVSTWYFDPATKRWAQEPSSRSYDVNGVLSRDGFGEDKFAMLWNVDKSTPKFMSQTCYGSCHVFTPYKDNGGLTVSNAASGNHYTNGANEKIDMWWGHLGKDILMGVIDDNYQDWAGGPSVTNLVGGNGNGRHVDDITVSGASGTWPYAPTYTTAAGGSTNNRVSLKLDGTGSNVNVPKYVIPGGTSYYAITQAQIDDGTAKQITAVSSTGVLTYSGGTIDPHGSDSLDYQRSGDLVFGTDGAKCFPSYTMAPLVNGRADISASAVHTGSGWVIEYKRKLKTGDVLKQDIDFSSLEDQPFGVAIWNRSNYQHGIKPNLNLTFKK